jgi:DUF4097 and DUF4098 domain-containing protein YvlB
MMKLRSLALFAALLALAVAAPALAEKIEKDFRESFDVAPGHRLDLRHGDGDVTITPWDKDVLDIEVRYRAQHTGFSTKSSFEVEFRQSGDNVVVQEKEGVQVSVGFLRTYEHQYTIRAPRYLALELKGDDGDVEIEGFEGGLEARIEDGDMTLRGLRGRTVVELEDGDVEIEDLDGDLTLTAEDGDVRIADSATGAAKISLEDGDLTVLDSAGSFNLRSSDGDLRLERVRARRLLVRTDDGGLEAALLDAGEFDLDVRTGDGQVVLDLDPAISASFTIRTGDGSIRVDLPGVVEMAKENGRASGRIGDGSGRIEISTDDGRVVLREG